jgi:hypothetical protein
MSVHLIIEVVGTMIRSAIFILYLISFGGSVMKSQDLHIPTVLEVETESEVRLFVPIQLKYDSQGELLYGVGGLETTELDSLRPYIESNSPLRFRLFRPV